MRPVFCFIEELIYCSASGGNDPDSGACRAAGDGSSRQPCKEDRGDLLGHDSRERWIGSSA